MEYINNSSFLDSQSNKVQLSGTIKDYPTFSYKMYDESFYQFKLSSMRTSGTEDIINLIIPEHLLNKGLAPGKKIIINGEIHTYNYRKSPLDKSRLLINIYVKDFEFLDDNEINNINDVSLEGTICKEPIYRRTPVGKEITDILVAVNRKYGKSDYIPCICWGKIARTLRDMQVGSKVKFNGRIQSRAYKKKLSEYEFEDRIAYEVSVFNLI